MSKYNGLDQYALSLGKIEYADTVHHIKVASEYPELFYSPDNLIPVSRRNHDEIHMKYRAGGKTRAELEQYLKSLVSHDPLVVK
ncbi:MAG: hypothetical protein KBS66_05650 [Eubacterium sp.]|nr:hypothetical protein [Candidatus Colimonas fimequi]